MKNLFLTFAFIFIALIVNAQSQSYYLIEGRQSQLPTVTDLVNNLNQTQHAVYPRVNNALGKYFRISYFKNNTFDKNSSKLVHLSDMICANIRQNLNNPQTGQAIGAVCGGQIGIINSILKLGLGSSESSIDTRLVQNNQTKIIHKIDTLQISLSNMEYNNQSRFKATELNADNRHKQEMGAMASISKDVKKAKRLGWYNAIIGTANLGLNIYSAVRPRNNNINIIRNNREEIRRTGPTLDPSY